MSCPAIRMKNKGSGYVKESTGNTELNKQMSARLAQRDAQVNTLFHPTPKEGAILKQMTIKVLSLALDEYAIEPTQREVRYMSETEPDWGHVKEVVLAHLTTHKIRETTYLDPVRHATTYCEVARFVHARWGACMVLVNL
jgi:hypothetical protein